MEENKRYYWLKLNEDFFENDTMAWLEEQDSGKDYVIFYLKLALKSLKDDGHLIRYVGQKLIPYDIKALSKLTNTSVDTVNIAMKLFIEIGLVSQLETGEIYLNQINEMIGSETRAAERMRKLRAREKNAQLAKPSDSDTGERNNVQESYEDVQESDTEIEIDKEIDKEKEKKNSRNSGKPKYADDSPYLELATGLFAYMKKNNEEAKEPNLQSWADDMRKLVELDGRSIENVKEVIRWSQRDEFWKGNILSAKKLREKYDQLKVQASNTKASRPGERPVLSGKEESYAGIDF